MPSASPTTVTSYLASLPAERRKVVGAVRAAVRKAMPKGYRETLAAGMIVWVVPRRVLVDTYNGQELWYVALAAQRNYYALHLMGCYGSAELLAELRAGYRNAGLKLDMGKACVRFRSLDDVALDVIGPLIARVPMDRYVAIYHASRPAPRT